MEVVYRPGKSNPRADALSRREQDMPANASDERLSYRNLQVFKPATAGLEEDFEDEALKCYVMTTDQLEDPNDTTPLKAQDERNLPITKNGLERLWLKAQEEDSVYQEARKAVEQGARRFPTSLDLKLS